MSPMIRTTKEAKEAKWRDIGLTPDGAPEGYLNFGLNGSYLVVRELRQYVERFWDSMKQIADRINKDQPGAAPVNAEWVAERVIGRNVNGDLLCPASVSASGYLKPDAYGDPQNQFRFRKDDPDGFGCPLGSHVRRANPRDGLAKDMGSADTLLDAANNHRILRRGRKFGTSLARDQKDDGTDRGLLFMCLNTDIARQFEFVQHVWLLNTNFATLFDETDPLDRPQGRFHDSRTALAPHRQCRDLHSDGRRRLFLPAEHAGAEIHRSAVGRLSRRGGDAMSDAPVDVLRPAQGGIKGWISAWTLGTALPCLLRVLQWFPWNRKLGVVFATRHDEVREVFLNDAAFRVPYEKKLHTIMDGQPFFLGMDDTQTYRDDVHAMRKVVDAADIPSRLKPRVLELGEQYVAAAGGRIEVVDYVRRLTFALYQDYFGIPDPPQGNLPLWATRLFEFQFADGGDDPSLRKEVDDIGPKLRGHIDGLIAARKGKAGGPDNVLGRCVARMDAGEAGFDALKIRTALMGFIVGGPPQPPMVVPQALEQLLRRPDALRGRTRGGAQWRRQVAGRLRLRSDALRSARTLHAAHGEEGRDDCRRDPARDFRSGGHHRLRCVQLSHDGQAAAAGSQDFQCTAVAV